MNQPEKLHFKTSSGIKNIVGKDLITDRFVAIFELVKNAYDAKASKVIVSFDFDIADDEQNITIRDNGIGMSRDDLENKWLHLAYSDKKEGQSNEDRAFVGSKGIGRFSCDSLGATLVIRSKKVDEQIEHQLNVNWADFEDDLDKRFESIDINYFNNNLDADKAKKSYTILEIKGLRHDWNKKSIDKVTESLRRLKNPFNPSDGFDIYCGENILSIYKKYDDIPEKFHIKSNIAEVLKDKSITIETTINNNIKVELFDRGIQIYTIQKTNDTTLKDVDIFISLNYLTSSAKSTFTRRMGIEPVNYGNVFVYRNNFGVSPYGNVDYDLFGLNTRKTQGHSRYIATRELIGHINIFDSRGIFKETSSRNNGFIENIYLEALEDVYMKYAHRHLERYVNLINWGEDSDSNEEIHLGSVDLNETDKFKRSLISKVNGAFELKYFAENVSFEDNNPKKQLEKIAANLPYTQRAVINNAVDKFEVLEKENQEKDSALATKQQTISALEVQKQNLLTRRPDSSYHEQLTHHFPKLIKRLNSGITELNTLAQNLPDAQKSNLYQTIKKIRRSSLELASIKYLLLKTTIDFRAATRIDWFEFVTAFAREKNPNSTEGPIKVLSILEDENAKSNWSLNCNALELSMMFENFYANAVEHSATYLQFEFKSDSIEITSDSTPITTDNLERVFEAGFSTKVNGTGIGLNQIKTFLKDKCNLKIRALNFDNEVCFQIYI